MSFYQVRFFIYSILVGFLSYNNMGGYHGWIPLSIQITGMRWPNVDLWFFKVSNWSLIIVEMETSNEIHT